MLAQPNADLIDLQESRPAVPEKSVQPGLRSHCVRVASLALEIASRLRLSSEAQQILEQSALLHHYPLTLLDHHSLDHLMTDLCGQDWHLAFEAAALSETVPRPVAAVLHSMHGTDEKFPQPIPTIAEVIELANMLDEQIGFLPYEYKTMDQLLDEVRSLEQDGLFRAQTLTALTSLPRARKEDLLEIVYRLPVFPSVALKALQPTDDDGLDFAQLHDLASSDQVLAGNLIQVANSGLYSPVRQISTIRQAISYIGLKAARKILMAAVVQRLFTPANVRELWKHSLLMAQFSERLAVISGCIDPKEAFLAGLVHDVGRLAMHRLTGEVGNTYTRLIERGCEPVFAEIVLCRFDHATAGGDILRQWNFPPHLTEGVQHHHQPERSDEALASLLYMAEYWCGSEEDIPCAYRLKVAMERTGVSIDSMQIADDRNGLLDCLIGTA